MFIYKSGKLLIAIGLLIAGIIVVFIRFYKNKESKSKLKKILKRIDADPEYAKKIAADLTCFLAD